eukprot:1194833-Prorocentrum_minimum.AAC.2
MILESCPNHTFSPSGRPPYSPLCHLRQKLYLRAAVRTTCLARAPIVLHWVSQQALSPFSSPLPLCREGMGARQHRAERGAHEHRLLLGGVALQNAIVDGCYLIVSGTLAEWQKVPGEEYPFTARYQVPDLPRCAHPRHNTSPRLPGACAAFGGSHGSHAPWLVWPHQGRFQGTLRQKERRLDAQPFPLTHTSVDSTTVFDGSALQLGPFGPSCDVHSHTIDHFWSPTAPDGTGVRGSDPLWAKIRSVAVFGVRMTLANMPIASAHRPWNATNSHTMTADEVMNGIPSRNPPGAEEQLAERFGQLREQYWSGDVLYEPTLVVESGVDSQKLAQCSLLAAENTMVRPRSDLVIKNKSTRSGNWTQGEKRGRVSGVLSAPLPLLATGGPVLVVRRAHLAEARNAEPNVWFVPEQWLARDVLEVTRCDHQYQRTNQTHEVWVYSRDRPLIHMKRGHHLRLDTIVRCHGRHYICLPAP